MCNKCAVSLVSYLNFWGGRRPLPKIQDYQIPEFKSCPNWGEVRGYSGNDHKKKAHGLVTLPLDNQFLLESWNANLLSRESLYPAFFVISYQSQSAMVVCSKVLALAPGDKLPTPKLKNTSHMINHSSYDANNIAYFGPYCSWGPPWVSLVSLASTSV